MELLQPEAALRRRTLHCNSTPGAGASTSGCFSPRSVQFKGKINDALPRKRHQKRHLEFCTAYLLSRGSPVRGWPGAPLFWNSLKQYELDKTVFTRPSAFWTDGRRRQDARVFLLSSIDP